MLQYILKNSRRRASLSGKTHDGHGDQLRDPTARCETLELVRTDYITENLIVRKRISEMVKSIATTLSDE